MPLDRAFTDIELNVVDSVVRVVLEGLTQTWKAIVETGALEPAEIRTLATAAIAEGADLVKSSTGKGVPGVTPEAAAILAATVRDADRTVGLKLSGGIRGVGQAANHLAQVRAILGPDWAAPSRFRIGASALLDALVA